MKNYLKNEIKHLPLILILFILFYGITTLATTTLFNSNEVKYNNTTSNIQSDNVQGAIDELYACASNYGAYNTRLTNTENTIGTGSLTTTSNTLIGGVNELNNKLIPSSVTFSNVNQDVTVSNLKGYKIGRIVILQGWLSITAKITAGTKMFDISVHPLNQFNADLGKGGSTSSYIIVLNKNGKVAPEDNELSAGWYSLNVVYICE